MTQCMVLITYGFDRRWYTIEHHLTLFFMVASGFQFEFQEVARIIPFPGESLLSLSKTLLYKEATSFFLYHNQIFNFRKFPTKIAV